MTVRPCLEPNCPALTTGSRCAVHQREWQRRQYRLGQARGTPWAWKKLRQQVLERDGGRCVRCGTPWALQVHHVNGNKRDDRIENLVALCPRCHGAAHRGEGRRTSGADR